MKNEDVVEILTAIRNDLRDIERDIANLRNNPQQVRHVHEPLPKPYSVRIRLAHPNGSASSSFTFTEGTQWAIPTSFNDNPSLILEPRRWWQRKTYRRPAPAPTLLIVEEIK